MGRPKGSKNAPRVHPKGTCHKCGGTEMDPTTRNSYCLPCQRKITEEVNQRGRQRLIAAKVARGACAGPGENQACPFRIVCTETNTHWFDLDHLDPSTKKYTIGLMNCNSDGDFEAEMAKCEMVCKICHAERTKTGRDNGSIKVGRPRKVLHSLPAERGPELPEQ